MDMGPERPSRLTGIQRQVVSAFVWWLEAHGYVLVHRGKNLTPQEALQRYAERSD